MAGMLNDWLVCKPCKIRYLEHQYRFLLQLVAAGSVIVLDNVSFHKKMQKISKKTLDNFYPKCYYYSRHF